MSNIAARIAATFSALVVALAAAGPAHAAIRFTKVQYDSPGTDTGSNASLNDEWIVVKNTGSKTRQLRGWTIRDDAGFRYEFASLRLKPGRRVKVHTGSGDDSRRQRYWSQDWYVWNNAGDRATLRSRSGKVKDRCQWDGGQTQEDC